MAGGRVTGSDWVTGPICGMMLLKPHAALGSQPDCGNGTEMTGMSGAARRPGWPVFEEAVETVLSASRERLGNGNSI